MIRFELYRIFGGWRHASIPDNVEVTVQSEEDSNVVEASLWDLLEVYGMVVNEMYGTRIIGTGDVVKLEPHKGRLRLYVTPFTTGTDFDCLSEELESLLTDVFRAHDEAGQQERRSEELAACQSRLDRKDIELDVQRLYHELTDTTM